MIKKLWVDNYKALNAFEISFAPFTLMVGNNAAGKTSVMEALDFLAGSVRESFDIILERRQQTVESIISKLKESSEIYFKCELELEIGGRKKLLRWEMQVETFPKKNIMTLIKERVTDLANSDVYLEFDCKKGGFLKGKRQIELPALPYKISILNHINTEKDGIIFPELTSLKAFWEQSVSFGMLSSDKMRFSRWEETDTIGRKGEKLPSYIRSMSAKRLQAYQDKLHELFGSRQDSISTAMQNDFAVMEMVENFGGKKVNVTSLELSDGMLRLLAFLAISEMDGDHVLFMLDEIENGVNTGYSEKLIQFLKRSCSDKKQQFIMATHSTVFLDYVNAEEIRYLFRDEETGESRAVSLFELPTFKERLKNFYPGEILLNLSGEEILAEIKEQN